jgi:hypothetical protein
MDRASVEVRWVVEIDNESWPWIGFEELGQPYTMKKLSGRCQGPTIRAS